MFINPMWDNESQRIGKQRCTSSGYKLHALSDLIGLISLLLLLGSLFYFVYRGFSGSFTASLLWLLVLPVALGVFGRLLYWYSWVLASRKGFRYDYERREATWLENGQRQSYRYGQKDSYLFKQAAASGRDID